jgi:hypothetical protein
VASFEDQETYIVAPGLIRAWAKRDAGHGGEAVLHQLALDFGGLDTRVDMFASEHFG